jgi:hypothetical protein
MTPEPLMPVIRTWIAGILLSTCTLIIPLLVVYGPSTSTTGARAQSGAFETPVRASLP